MKKNILITILTIIILCLSGYLVYDKFISNEKKENDITQNDRDENISTENESPAFVTDLINGKVIQTYKHSDGIDLELKEYEIPYVQATIPYINIDKTGAIELNKKIQNDFSDDINIIKNNITEQVTNKGPYYRNINYNYTVRNNILFILVSASTGSYRASGGGLDNSYYYDLENDKILNAKEVIEKLGLPLDYITNNIKCETNDITQQVLSDIDSYVSLFVVGNNLYVSSNGKISFDGFNKFIYLNIP